MSFNLEFFSYYHILVVFSILVIGLFVVIYISNFIDASIAKIMISIISLVSSSWIDMKDPESFYWIIIFYFGGILFQLLAAVLSILRIYIKNSQDPIRAKSADLSIFNFGLGDDSDNSSMITVSERYHDYVVMVKEFSKVLFAGCVTAFLYWKAGLIRPLVLTTAYAPANLAYSPIILVHLLFFDDKHKSLRRPWCSSSDKGFWKKLNDYKKDMMNEGGDRKKKVKSANKLAVRRKKH